MQQVILNCDVDGIKKTTDFSFISRDKDVEIILRLTKNKYPLKRDEFNSLTINFIDRKTLSSVFTKTYQRPQLITSGEDELLKVVLPQSLVVEHTDYKVQIRVIIGNISRNLRPFRIMFYEENSNEVNKIRNAVISFNEMWNKYIHSVKKDQINTANGVIGLGSNADMSINLFPTAIAEHQSLKIYSDEPHLLRLNKKSFYLEYYDTDAESWQVVDRLNGGEFTTERKDLIFDGGTFTQ